MKYCGYNYVVILSNLLNFLTLSLANERRLKDTFTITNKCLTESAEINLKTTESFTGLIYVQHQLSNELCVKNITHNQSDILFTVDFKECLADKEKNPQFNIIVQPNFHYRVKGTFRQPIDCSKSQLHSQIVNVKNELNFNEIPIHKNISSNGLLVNDEELAEFSLADIDGNNVTMATVGDKIKLEILLKPTLDGMIYKYGNITHCEIQDAHNSSNKKTIYDVCLKNNNFIDEWQWDVKNQKFTTNFSVTTLPDIVDIAVLCRVRICPHKCPRDLCARSSSPSTKRRRRQINNKYFSLTYQPRINFHELSDD